MPILCTAKADIKFLRQVILCGSCFLFAAVSVGQDSNSFDDLNIPLPRAPLCFGMSGVTEPEALKICDALYLKQTVKARELAQQWIKKAPI